MKRMHAYILLGASCFLLRTGVLLYMFFTIIQLVAPSVVMNKTSIPMLIDREVNQLDPHTIHIIDADLNSWGKVQILTGVVGGGRKPYPLAFLINKNGEIIYQFSKPAGFPNGLEIIHVTIDDINGDGLKDIMFFLDGYQIDSAADKTSSVVLAWVQSIDGEFHYHVLES